MGSWFPENISTYGGDLDSLYYFVYYVVGAWFVAAEVLLFYLMIRYRRRAGHPAQYIRGDTWSQLAWVLVPTIIVFGLDMVIEAKSGPLWARIKEVDHFPTSGVEVHVSGKQFQWEFTYPGPDGKFGTDDDLTIGDELHVPVNKNILLDLQAKDVLHSFFLPNVRLKQDAVPGRTIKMWFNATKPGEYEVVCAELCGFGHSGMKGAFFVHTPEEYDKWVSERWPATAKAASTNDTAS